MNYRLSKADFDFVAPNESEDIKEEFGEYAPLRAT